MACLRAFMYLKHLDKVACPGHPSEQLHNDALAEKGHDCALMSCSDDTLLIACRRCGAMSSGGHVRSLGLQCQPTDKGRNRTWNPLRRGKHPKRADIAVDVGPTVAP